MRRQHATRTRAVLNYPEHWFTPEDLLTFIELRPFTRSWEQLRLSDSDLQALQVMIMTWPKSGDVIKGAGGLRKLRFSPAKWPSGKSGGLRVCYSYFEEVATIVFALVYAKNKKDDLDEDEKAAIRIAIERVGQSLMSRSYRCNQQGETRPNGYEKG